MAISVTCLCRRRFRVHDQFGGERIPCPYCAHEVLVPLSNREEHDRGARSARPENRRSRPSNANPTWMSNGALGLASAVFGLAGAVAYGSGQADWGAAIAVLGLASSFIGLIWARPAYRGSVIGPFVGLVFCGTIAALALTVSRPELTGLAAPRSSAASQEDEAARPGAAPTHSERQGDFVVEVAAARFGRPRVRDLYSQEIFDLTTAALIVSIEVRNVGTTHVADYRNAPCRVLDNLGNSYQELNLGTRCLVERTLGDRHLSPGKSLRDVLVFDRPLDKAAFLDLELSGEIVGVPAPFHFHIPTSFIEGRETN